MADLFWEKSTAGWWLISQTNRANEDLLQKSNAEFVREYNMNNYGN
jgi:hypothetical protein